MTHHRNHNSAFARAVSAMRAQASLSSCQAIKGRAREYLENRKLLDMLYLGANVSSMTPENLIKFVNKLLSNELASSIDAIVPVRLINTKAAIVTGRYWRAKERTGKEANLQ
ncbi:MAG: hypothetical protein ACREBU_02685 [Nitrososphaera sp.]